MDIPLIPVRRGARRPVVNVVIHTNWVGIDILPQRIAQGGKKTRPQQTFNNVVELFFVTFLIRKGF